MEKLKIVEMKVSDLVPYEKNPRRNENAVDKVAASIKKFGFKVPIVVDKNNVICMGHTRLKAAIKLGMETVPVHVASDLTQKQIKALRLADNKVAEFAAWDYDLLGEELKGLADFDMSELGFSFNMDETEDEEQEEEEETEERGYSITYELAFSNEDEQAEWYDFIAALKRQYADVDTIAQRVLIVAREWMNENG